MTRAKAWAALLGGLGTWGATAGADGRYSQAELWGLFVVASSAVTVWAVPNKTARRRARRRRQRRPVDDDTAT